MLPLGQQAHDDAFEFIVVLAIDVFAELFSHDGFALLNQLSCAFACCGESHIHRADPRAVAQLKPVCDEWFEQRTHFFFHRRFADAACAQCQAKMIR